MGGPNKSGHDELEVERAAPRSSLRETGMVAVRTVDQAAFACFLTFFTACSRFRRER
jgi:hypothetical protein